MRSALTFSPARATSRPHHRGDVIQFMDDHPGEFDPDHRPSHLYVFDQCRVRWMYVYGDGNTIDQERWRNMEDGAVFFNQFKDGQTISRSRILSLTGSHGIS